MTRPEMPRLDISQIPDDVRDEFAEAVCNLIMDLLADPDIQMKIWPDAPADWLKSIRAMNTEGKETAGDK